MSVDIRATAAHAHHARMGVDIEANVGLLPVYLLPNHKRKGINVDALIIDAA